MYGCGNWTRAEIQQTPAREIIQHLVLARREDARHKFWQIRIASFHRWGKREQKSILDSLGQQSHFGQRRLKGTEQVDDATRVLMIGAELTVHGDRWARRNPQEMAWLESQGVSRVEATQRHADWIANERANPFWTPAAKG